jgi:hypothetical protein
MMPSRGMGAINPSKMPRKKEINRTDDPNKVAVYKEGGETKSDLKPTLEGVMSSDKYGTGGGGRAGFTKSIGKDTEIGAYLEGGGFKPKDGDFKGKVTGGGVTFSKRFDKGGEVWDKPNPAKKHKKLSPAKKAKAKAMAKAAGRPYPNLIDNMRMAK